MILVITGSGCPSLNTQNVIRYSGTKFGKCKSHNYETALSASAYKMDHTSPALQVFDPAINEQEKKRFVQIEMSNVMYKPRSSYPIPAIRLFR
jgi:hypothetical protein